MWALASTPLLCLGVLIAAWAIDGRVHNGKVVRNVEVAGQPIGGRSEAQARKVISDLADEFPDTPVTIRAGDLTIDTRAGDLGYSLDVDATLKAAMDAGRRGGFPDPLVDWAQSFLNPWSLPVALHVNETQLDTAVALLEGDRRTTPIEPKVEINEQGAVFTPGRIGRRIDPTTITRQLPNSVQNLREPIAVTIGRVVTPPKLTDAQVQAVADKANAMTSTEMKMKAGERTRTIEPEDLRALLTLGTDKSGAPTLNADPAKVEALIKDKYPLRGNPTGVAFSVTGSGVTFAGGADAQVCCDPKAADVVLLALTAGKHEVDLPLRTITAQEGLARAADLRINEVVGSFTTQYPAGQPRVKNIHRIVDLTRGVVIGPGETWSVNDFVGPRTTKKGFVTAPVIEKGEFTEDVGGGISQFATTLFNAAFFAGLEVPEYKSHSVYISRYPFGREATLAYPGVDLQVHNPTPYGVLLWPTYTNSSITVTLYSTRWATGEQTGQTAEKSQPGKTPERCGTIRTTRTRTFVDGHTETDRFKAWYTCDPPEH